MKSNFAENLLAIVAVAFLVVWVSLAISGPKVGIVFSNIVSDQGGYWFGTAFVWLDENENGVKDDGEAPLPDISFKLLSEPAYDVDVSGITDTSGMANLSIFFEDRSGSVIVRLQPNLPAHHHFTTQAFQTVSGPTYGFGNTKSFAGPFLFGLAQNPD